jgi:hypothetical protein
VSVLTAPKNAPRWSWTEASWSPSRCQTAAPTAFASAIWALSGGAPSIRPSPFSNPPSSTTATVTFNPAPRACSWAAAMSVWV